ncbi:MAG: kynureninase [Alphaproteobacteria bacterium]
MISRADLRALDASDPLARFRDRFVLPRGVIYLDGNSLGALPRETAARVARAIEREWGRDLIRSWNEHGWIGLPLRLGDKVGRLIGAAPGQVVVADSTSVNLFKLLAAALALRPDRGVILSEEGNFPTDLYVAQGVVELLGRRHVLKVVSGEDVPRAIDDSVAVVSLTEVNYLTGRRHDMAAVTAKAHAAGALTLWDLSHSAGAFPVALDDSGADFAVGCGYKYLCGGPGAPAFLYAALRHQGSLRNPLSGWMGHAQPFEFDPAYRPAQGIARLLCGTPPILSMTALECGVDLLLEADMAEVRAKSMALTHSFIALVEEECPGAFALASPRAPEERGSQVSLRHPHGYAVAQALIAGGVVPDFRAPDVVRFGFAPLYLRHVDVWDAVQALKRIIAEDSWRDPAFARRRAVT